LGRFMPKPKFKGTNRTMEVSEVMGPVLDPEAGLVSAKWFQCSTAAHGSSHCPEKTSAAVSRVFLGLSTSKGGCVFDPAVDSIKLSTSSRSIFPPLPTLEMLSLVSLDAPPAPVSSVVGFGSFGTSAPLPSSSSGACLTLQLRPEGSSQPIFAPSHFFGAAELGEKFHSYFSASPISKPFQKYYRKAREDRLVQLDDDLLAESVAAMRLLVSFTAEEAATVLPVKVFAGVAGSMKDIVKTYISKGFLRRGFLNSSPAVKVSTHSSLLESVVSL
jgi:hypothetical protein